jgi:uncharacterized protein YggE
MRTKTLLFALILILTALLSACGTTALAAQAQPPGEPDLRTLSVNGSGRVFLSPDNAYIAIGVHTEGEDATEAVASNNDQSQKVAEALVEFDIDPKDVQTRNFSIYPQQQFDQDGKVTGITYVVDNTMFVTIRDLDMIGEILDAVVSAGANSINSIQFDLENKDEALSQAREAAVNNAQAQAAELAEAAGVTLGEIQSINSFSQGYPVPFMNGIGGGAAMVESAVPISPGQLTLTADVNIVYQIQ